MNLQSLSKSLVLPICGLFLLAGCVSVDTREQLAVELPAEFSEQGTAAPQADWWLTLDDPALADAIEKAMSDNLTLLATHDRLVQAEAVARKIGANLYPGLDGSAQARENWNIEDETSSSTTLNLGLAASYEVDLWGRIRAQSEAATLDVEARRADLQSAAVSISSQVGIVWYQIAETVKEQDLVVEQRTLNEQILKIITAQFKAGQVGVADVMQQKGLIEANNGVLITLTARLHNQRQQLEILLGITPGTGSIMLPDRLVDLPPLPVTGIPADLVSNRPDIRSAYLELQAADQRVAEAVANRFPKLSLSADLSTGGESTGDFFNDWAASLAANLLGPIFDGGARRAEVDRTQAVASQYFHQYIEALIKAVGEVEEALVQEREQKKLLDNLAIRLELAKAAAQRIGDRYRQGAEDYQRVLTALLSLQNLQTDILQARQNLIEYRIGLYRSLGGQIALSDMEIVGADVSFLLTDQNE